jgi:hypothetical protein
MLKGVAKAKPGPDERRSDDDFLELGLLLMVTGLAIVLTVSVVEFLLLRESSSQSNREILLVGVSAVSGLTLLVILLARRLHAFLRSPVERGNSDGL